MNCKNKNCTYNSLPIPTEFQITSISKKTGLTIVRPRCKICERKRVTDWKKDTSYYKKNREINKKQSKDYFLKNKCKFQKNDKNGLVYFIQCPLSLKIKIGWSSNFEQRLKTYQTNHPEDLLILKTIPGKETDEGDILFKFEHLKCNPKKDWFYPTEELLNFIKSL